MEETTTTDNPFEENQPSNQWVKWLLTHAWNIITKESWFKWRLSRGEYWTTSVVIGLLSWILNLLFSYFWTIGLILWGIVSLLVMVYGIWLLTRRMHDFDKWWWWYFLTILKWIGIVAWLLILINFIFYVLNTFVSAQDVTSTLIAAQDPQAQTTSIISAIKNITNRLLGIAGLFVFLYPTLITYFRKGTIWENKYWKDRLLSQPSNNWIYWWVGIMLSIISILISVFGQNNTQVLEQMIQQRIWTQTNDIDTTNYPQINIDDSMSDQDIVGQIDTWIQAEDTAALLESETMDNTTTEVTETIN